MDLNPGGFFAWIFVGLIAGWLTGRLMRGQGYGCLGNLILGLIGAVIGGFLTGLVIKGDVGFIGSIAVATVGAILLVGLSRLVAGRRVA